MSLLDACFVRAAEDRRHGASEIERRLIADLLRERTRWTSGGLASRRGDSRGRAAGHGQSSEPRPASSRVAIRWQSRSGSSGEPRCLVGARPSASPPSAWPLIEGTSRILTISRSSAVAAVLKGAWRRGWRGETVVFDGSPGRERGGSGDSARRDYGTPSLAPPDSTMPRWFDRDQESGSWSGPMPSAPTAWSTPAEPRASARARRCRVGRRVMVVADSGKNLPDNEIDECSLRGPR